MKKLILCTIAGLAALSLGAAGAFTEEAKAGAAAKAAPPAKAASSAHGSAALNKALREQVEGFAAAWNRDDPKAMASFWLAEGDIIQPFGRVAKGRAELEKLFTEEKAGMTKGTHFEVKELSAWSLAPGLAAADIEAEITGGTPPPSGSPAPPTNNHIFAIAKQQGGTWRWWSVRAFAFLPAPPPAAKP
jgi:uncharacterized protein (TIGR02246 family)